jgi:hypothetical protein
VTDLSVPVMDLNERLTFLARQLHAIAQGIGDAKARNDLVALAGLTQLYVKVRADFVDLTGEAKRIDSPGALMTALANFSGEVDKVGAALGAGTVAVFSGLGTLARWLPWILAGAVVIVGLVYAGKIGKELHK